MCGRFYIEIGIEAEGEAGERMVFPTEAVHVRCAGETREMRWGFPGINGKGVLINARAETAAEKPTFRDALSHRRCLIPAKGFYEWRHERGKTTKERYRIAREDGQPLWMAGVYDEAGRFVILTQAADETVSPLHDRMPVLLPSPELQQLWLENADIARIILEGGTQSFLNAKEG